MAIKTRFAREIFDIIAVFGVLITGYKRVVKKISFNPDFKRYEERKVGFRSFLGTEIPELS